MDLFTDQEAHVNLSIGRNVGGWTVETPSLGADFAVEVKNTIFSSTPADEVFEGSVSLAGNLLSNGIYYAAQIISPVTVNLLNGVANGVGVGIDRLTNISSAITGAGDDTIVGNILSNILEAGAGIDHVFGGGGLDWLIGGSGEGDDFYDGGDDEDTVVYSSTSHGIVVNLSSVADQAIGAEIGTDQIVDIENVVGGSGDDSLTGDFNANKLAGGFGNDVLSGLADNDVLDGGAGADNLDGGANTSAGDTLSYDSSLLGVAINLATNSAQGGDAQGDIISNFENVTGSAQGDQLVGDGGVNVLRGLAGNDLFVGGLGADQMIGGADIDVVDYSGFATGVSINLTAGTGVGGDTLSEIENITGSAFGDVLQGDNGANTLRGGAGNDYMIAGNGADLMVGGADNDVVSYETSSAGVFVNLITGTGANGGVLQQIENITGSVFGDVFQGDNGANTIRGLAGNDYIIAGNGADLLIGGADNDTVSYETATTGVFANLATGVGANGGVLQEIENLTGSAFGDVLMGNVTGNTLKGGAGNDYLVGNNGSDALFGGADNDTFRFETSVFGNDVIADYQDNGDHISFGDAVATSFGQLTIKNNGTTNVTVQIVGQSIVVQGLSNITLTASDFLFV